MKRFINLFLSFAMVAGMLVLSPVHTASAATLTVTNTNNSGDGSLRQALLDANNGDIIDATGISGTITLTSELSVVDSITINGPGAAVLTVSGNNAVRVFNVITGVTANINNLTVSDGRVVDLSGGGIQNAGSLTLENVIITSNHVVKGGSDFIRGGGIHNSDGASLTVKDSTISNNSAVQNGGGIHSGFNTILSLTNVVIDGNSLSYSGSSGGGLSVRDGSTATLDRVSITGNTSKYDGGGLYSDASITMTDSLVAGNTIGTNAISGGGIYFNGIGKTFTLRNVTISGNSVQHDINNASGGGMYIGSGTLNLNNITITNNIADGDGGGVFIGGPATVNVRNTILAGNTSTDNASEECYGTLNSQGYNLIQDPTGCTIDGSIIGVLISLNPMLGALANNGGSTLTHALKLNSPGLDAGDNATCELTDQRGVSRPQNGICDMGAYELKRGKLTVRSISTQDGWVLENSENGNAGGSMDNTAIPLRLGDDAARKQYRSILSFNTAPLPDNAVITNITLKVKKHSIMGGGNPVTSFQGFLADVRKGTFGSAALQVTDWQAVANKTVGPFTPALSSGWYTLNLTTAKLQINKLATLGGLTQVRLRFQLDDNNNSVVNYLSLYSGNALLASRPQLIVEYYMP